MLKVHDVSYKQSERFSLNVSDLQINQGEIVSLIGPNGSGKSTWLRLVSKLIKPDTGAVLLEGKDVHSLKASQVAKRLAMLPQMNESDLDLTVGELIEYGRYPHKGAFQALNGEDLEIIDWALEVTNLHAYRNRLLPSLSGGERQRAWIAMAVAQRPEVLLLDEPTTYLDICHQLEVMELVQELNQTFNMTIVMVLHDINQAARYSDRLIALKNGEVKYSGIPQCVLCREMFQSIFEIDAQIEQHNGQLYFTPMRLKEEYII
ncbi:MAG TPA: ABC transporter ATP-binding protein [Candidatus Avamphibacillus intestinigallinarum]|nr:ABC transporter ATP-binding protein [Candidatus Avamphibacillus intestinigallinarum]